MSLEDIVGLTVAVLAIAYLAYVLVRPEKF
jgi:hypothetical protein